MRNNCLATLLGFLLAIFLTVFILANQVKVLTNPNFISKIIQESQVVNNLETLVDQIATSGQAQEGVNLNSLVLSKILAKSIEPNKALNELNRLVDGFLGYFQGETATLDLTIDLRDFKTTFNQNWKTLAPSLYRSEYDKLRACETNEKPMKMEGSTPVIDCQSPDLSAATLEEQAKQADIDSFLKNIPDEFSLADWIQKNQATFDKIRLGFNILKLIYWGSLILSLLCVISLIALGWPNARVICGWIGWIGVLVAGPIVVLDMLSQKLLQNFAPLQAAKMSTETALVLNPLIESVNRQMVHSTLILSLIISGVSVVLVILSFTLPRYEPRVIPPGFKEKLGE